MLPDRSRIEFSLKIANFVKDVTGRNKNHQKYQLWAYNGFIIPPSSEALPLHALIISLKPSGKIVKLKNELANFSHDEEFRSKISNSSFNFDLKTSCALPPYYSLELAPISSTSHYYLPGVAHLNDLLRQQSENAYLKSKNRWILRFCRVFLDFIIFSIFYGFKVVLLLISIPSRDFLPGNGSEFNFHGYE